MPDCNGCLPLVAAALGRNGEIFDLLLTNNIDLSIVDKNGNNTLHHIIKSKKYSPEKHDKYFNKIAKIGTELLNMKNNKGETPLSLQKKRGEEFCISK